MSICKDLIAQERQAFAQNLKKSRRELGLTQDDLANRTGLTQPFISAVERGESSISLDNAGLLAKSVGVPLWKLLSPEK